ncbi:hypothetical protein P154DRAFT_540429 [Amniculicola lignicola CBS 123094]|uniref:Uncharacterized protein n=1 Tax=Amniculicola lignicola CBS 123094 TaxID=1392246 RepID=A0A6A5W717_9PLEO|nr:hypothetical protein P154DRAFT_540429 [Amniculicola lignicola CBS 123094]
MLRSAFERDTVRIALRSTKPRPAKPRDLPCQRYREQREELEAHQRGVAEWGERMRREEAQRQAALYEALKTNPIINPEPARQYHQQGDPVLHEATEAFNKLSAAQSVINEALSNLNGATDLMEFQQFTKILLQVFSDAGPLLKPLSDWLAGVGRSRSLLSDPLSGLQWDWSLLSSAYAFLCGQPDLPEDLAILRSTILEIAVLVGAEPKQIQNEAMKQAVGSSEGHSSLASWNLGENSRTPIAGKRKIRSWEDVVFKPIIASPKKTKGSSWPSLRLKPARFHPSSPPSELEAVARRIWGLPQDMAAWIVEEAAAIRTSPASLYPPLPPAPNPVKNAVIGAPSVAISTNAPPSGDVAITMPTVSSSNAISNPTTTSVAQSGSVGSSQSTASTPVPNPSPPVVTVVAGSTTINPPANAAASATAGAAVSAATSAATGITAGVTASAAASMAASTAASTAASSAISAPAPPAQPPSPEVVGLVDMFQSMGLAVLRYVAPYSRHRNTVNTSSGSTTPSSATSVPAPTNPVAAVSIPQKSAGTASVSTTMSVPAVCISQGHIPTASVNNGLSATAIGAASGSSTAPPSTTPAASGTSATTGNASAPSQNPATQPEPQPDADIDHMSELFGNASLGSSSSSTSTTKSSSGTSVISTSPTTPAMPATPATTTTATPSPAPTVAPVTTLTVSSGSSSGTPTAGTISTPPSTTPFSDTTGVAIIIPSGPKLDGSAGVCNDTVMNTPDPSSEAMVSPGPSTQPQASPPPDDPEARAFLEKYWADAKKYEERRAKRGAVPKFLRVFRKKKRDDCDGCRRGSRHTLCAIPNPDFDPDVAADRNAGHELDMTKAHRNRDHIPRREKKQKKRQEAAQGRHERGRAPSPESPDRHQARH